MNNPISKLDTTRASRGVPLWPGRADAESLENEIGAPVRRRIAFEWNRRVKHHASMVALRDQNAVLFADGVTGDWDETVRPYGCTLLAAAFTSDLALWLRIGDGDALAVGHGWARRVFEAAVKSMEQATYSHNMRNATEHMRLRVELERCELTLLTSDGVGDQYDAEPRFEEEWGTHMLERVRAKGWIETVLDARAAFAGSPGPGSHSALRVARARNSVGVKLR